MFIPRIGQEVIVDFLEGDPDRPLITGRVYHRDNMPPYDLPAEKTKSTIKSNSSPNGQGFNEIRFEDKKGEEQLFLHAENTLDSRAKGPSREFVGGKRHLIVKEDQLEKVEGDKHLTVQGDHKEKVGGTISIESSGDLLQKTGPKYAVESQQEIHIKAGMKVVIEGGLEVTLKGPGGFVKVDPMGVTLQGNIVNINSGGAAGSGSGCSPDTPDPPEEADTAEPGGSSQAEFPAPASSTPQAQALSSAAQTGTPFCET
jgi:type VI secretion system secreted protein VgrG